MTDRPILFSAPMVQALLEGRKTQTRRLLKPQPVWEPETLEGCTFGAGWSWQGVQRWADASLFAEMVEPHVPYAIGDRLYVREAFAYVGSCDPGWLLYRANGYVAECHRHGFDIPFPPESEVTWKPSIHMPRAISRITLTVTDVRIQRLRDISEEDAVAEGIEHVTTTSSGKFYRNFDNEDCPILPVGSFRSLWNSLNSKRAPWDSNPWVVAISFDVKKGNIDA